MSLADPLAITISGTTYSLPRVSVGDRKATYQDGTGVATFSVSHQLGKRTRRVMRLDFSKVSADPFVADLNATRSMSVYTVLDLPTFGFSAAEAKAVYDGFDIMTELNSDALIKQVLNGES